MSAEEDLDQFEAEIELQLYQEYRAVLPMFRFVVETERRFYLANDVKVLRSRCNGDEAGPSGARAIPGRVLSQLRLCQFSVAEKVPAGVAGGWGLSWGYWMSKQACTGGY